MSADISEPCDHELNTETHRNELARIAGNGTGGTPLSRSALYSQLGHKGDLMMIHFRDSIMDLNRVAPASAKFGRSLPARLDGMTGNGEWTYSQAIPLLTKQFRE